MISRLFLWRFAHLSRDTLQNEVSHRCACVKLSTKEGCRTTLAKCEHPWKGISRYGATKVSGPRWSSHIGQGESTISHPSQTELFIRSFEKGLAVRGGCRKRNPSYATDWGILSVPFSCAPLGEGAHITGELFGLFWGACLVANPLPPTPFRNLWCLTAE